MRVKALRRGLTTRGMKEEGDIFDYPYIKKQPSWMVRIDDSGDEIPWNSGYEDMPDSVDAEPQKAAAPKGGKGSAKKGKSESGEAPASV